MTESSNKSSAKASRRLRIGTASVFLILAALSGVIILIDPSRVLTTLAKGLIFVFTVLSLFFIPTDLPSDDRARTKS